ncbi:unnamed protein product [Psylliodes chrysocephalus]|uniref:Uncharacterized protein n=1 Tax=Psylliodes chrysocephalus TaxID=3402493 RepID=A0A9P0D6A6_9CUCU|nr:unnamed protein product [Psylliodes chrysocephala]
MHNTIIKLESEKTLAIELFNIMQSLRSSLKLKKEQQFYGSIALSLLRKCDDHTKVTMFKREADVLLERIINYLEKWYNFDDDNKFKSLSAMALQNKPDLNNFLKICEDFHIEVNEDLLFEEYVTLLDFMEKFSGNFDELTADQQWVAYFKKSNAPP